MKWMLCFIGIFSTVIGLLNIIFYKYVPPILNFPESLGLALLGFFLMYVGREHLSGWVAYLLSGDNGGSDS